MALNRREFHSDFQFTDQQKLFRDSISIKKLAQFEHLTNFDKFLIWFSSGEPLKLNQEGRFHERRLLGAACGIVRSLMSN